MEITIILISTMCTISAVSPVAGPLPLSKKEAQVAPVIGKCKMIKSSSGDYQQGAKPAKGLFCTWQTKEKHSKQASMFYIPVSTYGNTISFRSNKGLELFQLTPTRFVIKSMLPSYTPDLIQSVQCYGKATYKVRKNKDKI